MTLVHPAEGTEENIVFSILRALSREIPIDERVFMRRYIHRDMEYREELDETCRECLLDDIILGALSDMGFKGEGATDLVHAAVDVGLATKEVNLYPDALEQLGVHEARCLHVGDDPIADIQGARGAGMKTAHVNRGGSEVDCDVQVRTLRDLLSHL